MNPLLQHVLADIEADASADAGAAFARLVSDYLAAHGRAAGRRLDAASPDDLAGRFDEPLPRDGQPLDEVLARVARDVLPDCNRLMDPRYMGHQVSAPLPAAVWAEALTAALNQSGAVWEMSPVGTVIETQVIRWLCDLAGLGPAAGGTFTSGGTEATFAGLLAARHAVRPTPGARASATSRPSSCAANTPTTAWRGPSANWASAPTTSSRSPRADSPMDVDALERELRLAADEGRR